MTAILPVMLALPFEPELQAFQEDALVELLSVGPLTPLDEAFGGSPIHVRVVDDPSQERLLAGVWKPPLAVRQYKLLVLELDVEHMSKRFDADVKIPPSFTPSQIESVKHQYIQTFFGFETASILLLVNILRPGTISVDSGYHYLDGKLIGETEPFFAEELFSAVTASQSVGWPSLLRPDITSGWNWLRSSGAVADGIGIGRIGRALAAVSHLTQSHFKETSSIGLMWILLGLEAIYSKGNTGLKEQLLAKSEAVLGPRTENKKAFGMVYDFRSRLLHGDVNLPLRFTDFDAVREFEEYHAELRRNEGLALAVLLATLQWMISNNTTELSFRVMLA